MPAILFHSPCGGTGLTTVVANLGVALARTGQTVLIERHQNAEPDQHIFNGNQSPHIQGSHRLHGMRKKYLEHNLYLGEYTDFDRPTGSAEHRPGLHGTHNRQISSEYVLRETHLNQLPDPQYLSLYDQLIIVVNTDTASFSRLAETINKLCNRASAENVPRILVLLNKYMPESCLSNDILHLYESALRQYLHEEYLLRDESVRESAAMGVPLTEHAPYSPVAHALQSLANRLITQCEVSHVTA